QTFDLTSQSAAILANEATPANFTLTYYASQADYTAGTAIANPTAYDNTSNPQSIVVEAEGPNNCTATTSFDLVVNPLPSYNTPVTQVVCDDATADGIAVFDLTAATNQLTGNNPNYNVDYYETPADLAAGTNALPSNYTNTTAYNQTIYFQIEDQTTGCLIDDAIDLQVDTAPAANTPQVYTFCDDDNDGFGLFNLPSLDNEITGGAAGVSVSYHQTLANAQNNALPLPANFTNTVNTTQVIYARVVSPGVACYTIVNVTLEVLDSPQPVLPQDLDALEACDTNNSGNAVFDLTQMEAAILANETNPSDFSLAYYESQADADAQTNPITVEQAYTSAGMNQTIYVVVTGNNGCTAQTQFELVVNPLPVITPPSALELCDYNNPGDEQESFDLTQATLEITGGDSSMQVTYYASQNDADTGSNPLSSPYTNTVNNETIYVRVEDQDTGCFVSQGFSLTLVVNPLPSPQVPVTPLEVCDVDNDGFAEFDLDAQTPIIENGELNVAISYHITQANAENGVNPIDTTQPYGLSSANTQTLYVRAENTQTGCYVVEVLQLEVVGTPEIGFLEDLYVCDDDYNGFAVFDLTQNTPNVVGAQTGVSVTYYESQADADAGINAIAVPQAYTNIVNPQRIFVRVEDDTTGCYDTFNTANDNSFMLYVEELPVVSNPSILQVCDDDYNNVPLSQSIFNLTSKEGEMSGQNFPPNDYTFTYYESEQAYLNGDAPIATPSAYENIANPQSIYVVVVNTDTQNQCEQYVDLTIEVLPLPSPSETDPDVLRLQECDDDNDGVATNAFDLTQSGALIAAGENVDLNYYTSEAAAEAGDTTVPEYIANPTSYTNDPSLNTVNDQGMTVQVIYVRVDSGVNGNFCFVIVPIEIQAVRVPVLTNIDPFGYTLCEDGSSGTAAINLEDIAYNLYDASVATPDPSVLVDLLDANENDDMNLSNYDISYHFDQIGAQNDTNEVPNGYQASTGDTFWIRVVYTDTGCQAAVGRVAITVEPRPVIAGIDTTLEVCSDEQGGNTATVDLTQFDAQINPGSPANTRVIYYASLDDYLNAAAPIDQNTLTAYVTTENPQTIIGVVQDTNNLCESVDYATISIEIAPRPIVDISSYDGMVICADSDNSTPVEGGNYDPVFIETGLDEINYSFVWTLDGGVLPETGSSIEVTSAGTYTVTVTDVFSNCESSSSASFTAGNPPEFDVIPLTLAFDEQHAAQVINISGNGDYEFNIDNGPWTAVGSDGSITFSGLSAGVHFVYGRDKNGCGTTVREIAFIDYPKFFTPNEDGYNDTWNIIGLGEANIGAKIFIFDRYGKLLKQLSPSGPGWDGTFNGK
ncbi:T9SS type B sorting domain-containing protein, partial [Mesonia sp. HuA40]|uniref:T9SS type B sorting domain-containing protein n=1 Tax=Mesonia sp. HuA40 TaxID=2602761 RepID=UPI0011C8C655